LDRQLFSKLFLVYYLKIMKINFGCKDHMRNELVTEFHNSVGRMICDMIDHKHFTDHKLAELAYKMIYIEKTSCQDVLDSIFKAIKKEFWPFYLAKEHSLTTKPEDYDKFRQISRCFLDELYLRSLKEAEDPDIINDTNEGFGVLKCFPILRVREDKHR
jgi:hypothetical protein